MGKKLDRGLDLLTAAVLLITAVICFYEYLTKTNHLYNLYLAMGILYLALSVLQLGRYFIKRTRQRKDGGQPEA